MKTIFPSNQVSHLLLMPLALLFLIVSCNENSVKQSASKSTQVDSTVAAQHDSLSMAVDTSFDRTIVDSSKENHVDRNPASVPVEEKVAKGIALVYCPANMIRSVPSIVNAAISKEDLSTALKIFTGTVQTENPDINPGDITRDTRNDTIDLYERMEVKIEFDPDDFVQIGKDDEPVKEFGNKNMLEW